MSNCLKVPRVRAHLREALTLEHPRSRHFCRTGGTIPAESETTNDDSTPERDNKDLDPRRREPDGRNADR